MLMSTKKENLEKLVRFVDEIANQNGNEWLKRELISKFSVSDKLTSQSTIDEIYEYCIRIIIKEQAEKFYSDFKLNGIRGKLIADFIRMEKFRREDNFEDFCLALFQQIEGIVNELMTADIQSYIQKYQDLETHKAKNIKTGINETQKLWQLIFYPALTASELSEKISKPILDWDFLERYKAILFIYYFNKKIYNYHDYKTIYFMGSDLYQSRNLNHRGGKLTDKQKNTIDKVTSNSYKYYFKFLGFLEEFSTKVNANVL